MSGIAGGDDLHYADYLVRHREGGGIGAFIAEPIRNTDVQVPSKAYWQRVREICDRHKVLLIVDEIPNALGRTGHWFSFEEFGIEPDIICLGKGLGRGGAICSAHHPRPFQSGRSHLARSLHPREEPHRLRGGPRHDRNNPRSGLLAKVQEDGRFMARELAALAERHPLIGQVRGIGLLWALDLVVDHRVAPAIARPPSGCSTAVWIWGSASRSLRAMSSSSRRRSISRAPIWCEPSPFSIAPLARSCFHRNRNTTMTDLQTAIDPATDVEALILDWAGTVVDFGSFAPPPSSSRPSPEPMTSRDLGRSTPAHGSWQGDHIAALGRLPSVDARWRAPSATP